MATDSEQEISLGSSISNSIVKMLFICRHTKRMTFSFNIDKLNVFIYKGSTPAYTPMKYI